MLRNIFPASVRKTLYLVGALIGLILGATQVGFTAARVDQPVWLTVSFAIFGFLSTALGLTAAGNTPNEDRPKPVDP